MGYICICGREIEKMTETKSISRNINKISCAVITWFHFESLAFNDEIEKVSGNEKKKKAK